MATDGDVCESSLRTPLDRNLTFSDMRNASIKLSGSGFSIDSLNYSSQAAMLVVASLLVVVIITMALGNFLVGLSLVRFRNLRTVSNFLIGNLAASDFLLATTVLPLSTANECLGRWVFGQAMCNVWLLADVLYCTASIWNLCVIAFDRYTATMYPLWYRERRSAKQAGMYVVLVWLIAEATCLPPLFGWNDLSENFIHDNVTDVYQCILFQTPSYVIYSASVSFYVPFLLTVCLYVRIFVVLRRRLRSMRGKTTATAAKQTLPPETKPAMPDVTLADATTIQGQPETLAMFEVDSGETKLPEALNNSSNCDESTNSKSVLTFSDTEADIEDDDDDDDDDNDDDDDRDYDEDCTQTQMQPSTTLHSVVSNIHDDFKMQNGFDVDADKAFALVLPVSGDTDATSTVQFVTPPPSIHPTSWKCKCGGTDMNDLKNVGAPNLLRIATIRKCDTASSLSRRQTVQRKRASSRRKNVGGSGRQVAANRRSRSERREMRATVRMAAIIGVFCGMWIGFFTLYVIGGLCTSCRVPRHLEAFVFWLGYANSAINPILYAIFNDEFRLAFKKLLGCHRRGQRSFRRR